MKNPCSGCVSSRKPCGSTVPHEWTFGSMSGASRLRRLDDLVEIEPDLSQDVEVRAESGGVDHHVGRVGDDLAVAVTDQFDAIRRRGGRG